MAWSSMYANDPDRRHALYLELLLDEEPLVWVQYDRLGQIEVRFIRGDAVIPSRWLFDMVEQYRRDVVFDPESHGV